MDEQYEFKCPICAKVIRFKYLRELLEKIEEHFNAEHPEYKNKCLICDAVYNSQSNLLQHLINRHTVTLNERETLLKCIQHMLLVKGGRRSAVVEACIPVFTRNIRKVEH